MRKDGKQVDIANDLGISDRTIRRATFKLREYGDIEGGKKKAGPKPKLSDEMKHVMSISLVIANVY